MILSRFSRSECHQAAKALQSYLDGELDPAAAAMVGDHLEICQACGLEASAYLAIKTVISSTGAETTAVDTDAVDRLVRFARELSDTAQD
jgi:anti-sigma factor RsiW